MKTYDPKCREAMAEIEAVMEKYDMGGFVVLSSLTHNEFKLFIEPSWSMARVLTDHKTGVIKGIHFKVRKAHPVQVDATAGMIAAIRDLGGMISDHMDRMMKQLGSTVGIEYDPFGPVGIKNDDR